MSHSMYRIIIGLSRLYFIQQMVDSEAESFEVDSWGKAQNLLKRDLENRKPSPLAPTVPLTTRLKPSFSLKLQPKVCICSLRVGFIHLLGHSTSFQQQQQILNLTSSKFNENCYMGKFVVRKDEIPSFIIIKLTVSEISQCVWPPNFKLHFLSYHWSD